MPVDRMLSRLRVRGAALLRMPVVIDPRGALTFGEVGAQLPFEPRRFFVVYDVPSGMERGEHAHREIHQFVVCLRGTVRFTLDDGTVREQVLLDTPAVGLHIPPMTWGVQDEFSPDAVMLVLASDVYDPDEYVRDHDEFISLTRPHV